MASATTALTTLQAQLDQVTKERDEFRQKVVDFAATPPSTSHDIAVRDAMAGVGARYKLHIDHLTTEWNREREELKKEIKDKEDQVIDLQKVINDGALSSSVLIYHRSQLP